jgi:hypothetical protein
MGSASTSTSITHESALRDLRAMFYTVQKARSIMAENGWTDPTAQHVLTDIAPYVWGDKCILPALDRIIRKAEQANGKVYWQDYYNVLIIAHRLDPFIALATNLAGLYWSEPDGTARQLPEPDLMAIMAALGSEVR